MLSSKRTEELDKQLCEMTEEELDKAFISAMEKITEKKESVFLNVNTTKYAPISWLSPAGRAYAKWAVLIMDKHRLPNSDKNFLTKIAMKAVVLNEDNVHQLRYLGNKYRIDPTTGDKKRDEAIWSYVHGHITWGEMESQDLTAMTNAHRMYKS